VVRAFHSKHREFLALKYTELNDLNNQNDEYDQCLDEVNLMNILSSAKSPNIISLLQFALKEKGNNNFSFIIKMEYASCNMKEILKLRSDKHIYYFPDHALFICLMVLNGLLVGKKLSVCHRDVKDENILIFCPNNSDFRNINYRIADWGEGKILQSQDIDTVVKHSVRGSPKFMAPEIKKARKPKKAKDEKDA
jgi:serine/threonine protein kinase